jgi:hypothetical protein
MPQDGTVISIDTARRLRAAGLPWTPRRGDRFVVADRGMDDEVFVLSDMTIEVHQFPSGPVIGFNGTTEWALDSLEQQDALWLPSETQLRHLLSAAFVRLDHVGTRFRVAVDVGTEHEEHEAEDAADAYALGLLRVITVFGVAGITPLPAE